MLRGSIYTLVLIIIGDATAKPTKEVVIRLLKESNFIKKTKDF
jgi:hypothetical protein